MSRKLYKKHGYEEYFINRTLMEKMYNFYFKKHLGDTVLDILVIFAILSTVLSVAMEYFIDINWKILIAINSFSVFVFLIFALELIRDYFESKNREDFFKHHWIDFILISFLSVHFLFVYIFGFLNFFLLQLLKPLFSDLKEMRIFFKIFKK